MSGKPADDEHHYGHGKVESVAALAETALLFFLSGIVIWEAVKRLLGEEHAVEATISAFAVIVAVDRHRFLPRARALQSGARDDERGAGSRCAAFQFRYVVVARGSRQGLPASRSASNGRTPPRLLWSRSSFCSRAGGSARRTIDTLLDTAPPGVADEVTAIARRVPGVVAVERVRVRQVGPDQFVELNVSVSRTMPIDRVASLKDAVTKAVCAELPKAEISIVTEPRALDNETILDRVMVIARNRGLAVHHVTVHAIGEKLSVSLDLEVDGSLTLGAAHDIADGLEDRDHRRTGRGCRGRNPYRAAAIRRRCSAAMPRPSRVDEVQAALVRARGPETECFAISTMSGCARPSEGEVINFHCNVDPSKTVHEVHEKVDDLERALRAKWPSIKRVDRPRGTPAETVKHLFLTRQSRKANE